MRQTGLLHDVLGLAAITLVASLTALGPRDAAAAPPDATMAAIDQYLIPDRSAEIALARSAAPAAISSEAKILVLTRRGYETAVEGKNGFVCMVDRAWQAPFANPEFWNPRIRGPLCLNPQAVRSVLPLELKRTEWALAGLSKDEMLVRLKATIAQQPLALEGAMSYMMSRDQYLNDQGRHWHPHLMFYTPGTIPSGDWGANLDHSPVLDGSLPLPGGDPEPVRVFLVPVDHWSDGTPASGDHRPSAR